MSGRMYAFAEPRVASTAVVLHYYAAPLTAEWIANVKKSKVDYARSAI